MAIPFRAEMEYQYNWLKANLCDNNDAFTSALMGNLYAESHCYSVCLQPSHFNDSVAIQYTQDVDDGTKTRSDFYTDQKGYGLAQWTTYARKQALYDYWDSRRTLYSSIGNLQMQLFYIRYEFMYGDPNYYKYNELKSLHNIDDCSDIICRYYEGPLILNFQDRRNYSHEFYNQYSGQPLGAYTITCISDTLGGEIYSSQAYANAGETIWLYHNEVAGVTFDSYSSSDVTIIDNSFTMPSSNVTITGHFTGSPTPTQGYPINIVTNKKGWVTAPPTAQAGDVVYITIPPIAKRKLIVIESADVTLTEVADGYSFYMPAHSVTIRVKFKMHKPLLVGRNPQLLYLERRY